MKIFWRADKRYKYKISTKDVEQWFNKKQSLVFSEEDAKFEERAIKPFIKSLSSVRVLDLGCGNGRWCEYLIPKCEIYIGVDISENFISSAKNRFNEQIATFICIPANQYKSSIKFDLILIIGLMTYMNDDEIIEMVNNCKKMLADDGRIIIRNVRLNKNINRMVYDDKWNLLKKLLRKPRYQIIRRNEKTDLDFFKEFDLVHKEDIKGTGSVFYVFKNREKK